MKSASSYSCVQGECRRGRLERSAKSRTCRGEARSEETRARTPRCPTWGPRATEPPGSSAAREAVLLQLVPEDALADSQDLGGPGLDAVGPGQGLADHPPLQPLHQHRQARLPGGFALALLHTQGEVLEADDLVPGEDHGALHEVLELPHVSREVVAEEGLAGVAGEAADPLAGPAGGIFAGGVGGGG